MTRIFSHHLNCKFICMMKAKIKKCKHWSAVYGQCLFRGLSKFQMTWGREEGESARTPVSQIFFNLREAIWKPSARNASIVSLSKSYHPGWPHTTDYTYHYQQLLINSIKFQGIILSFSLWYLILFLDEKISS